MTPHRAPFPYADYMVLEFCKDGTFREASNVFHITDDMDIKDLSSALTLQLKNPMIHLSLKRFTGNSSIKGGFVQA